MKLKKTLTSILALCLIALNVLPLYSTSMLKMNMSDLISQADFIVVARVLSLTDGFGSNGLPYTEITIDISDALKGNLKGVHTFRQFGLLAPREMGNGRTYVGLSPDGFPKFASNEEVVLFLYHITQLGYQPIIGLMQGKFKIENGVVANAINNQGLFQNVKMDESKIQVSSEAGALSKSGAELDEADQQKLMQLELEKEKAAVAKLLSKKQGAIEKEAFISFVRNAVNQSWFE